MRYLVINKVGDVFTTEADSIEDACEKYDWKYPGTVISVSLIPDEEIE